MHDVQKRQLKMLHNAVGFADENLRLFPPHGPAERLVSTIRESLKAIMDHGINQSEGIHKSSTSTTEKKEARKKLILMMRRISQTAELAARTGISEVDRQFQPPSSRSNQALIDRAHNRISGTSSQPTRVVPGKITYVAIEYVE